jgi:alpha-amylase
MFQEFRNFIVILTLTILLISSGQVLANPWNGKVVFQGFWWDCKNENYPNDWHTYLAKLAPRLRDLGFDGIWIPSPAKGNSGGYSMGYDVFDHYDLGDKFQKGTLPTMFGNKDSLLRLIAVAHANGLEIYPDIVLNHTQGGEEDPQALGNRNKKFRYVGYAGLHSGRWAKDHWNFHPNPDHSSSEGDWCKEMFGPDNCYLDAEHGGGGNGKYMRDRAREWMVWLKKQTGADGFRFDAVKHFPPYVVEDLLYNSMGNRTDYFAVGELVDYSHERLDGWVGEVQSRACVFDFALRGALAGIVNGGGFFDMGSLPNCQQKSRYKTYPFVNNHDTWRGSYWDSNPGSAKHDDRDGDWRQNKDELAPTIDPDNHLAPVAYAAAFAVDGSPVIYYEDLFINYGDDRLKAVPEAIRNRDYLVNLIWAHQKLNFKDGAYKVRYQGSPDLLVVERSARAIIGMNDNGNNTLSAWVQTDFGPNAKLHDYSGKNGADLTTDDNGWVQVSVPPKSYALWGPMGVGGGFAPSVKRTTQEFQLADDLGDCRPESLGYGGNICPTEYRSAGSVWVASRTPVKVWLYTDEGRQVELVVREPDDRGEKSKVSGEKVKKGGSAPTEPLYLEFTASREGYHQLLARLTNKEEKPTRAYLKVEYQAPAKSSKF